MSDLQKITEQQMDAVGVCSAPDMLTGSASENKAVFDKMVRQLIAPAYNAAVDAIDAINQAESGIQAAEEARAEAEEGRTTEEEARAAAESGRLLNEQARVSAEQGRAQAEFARDAAEQNRSESEQKRAAAEIMRQQAEQQRVDATTGIVAQATEQAQAAQLSAKLSQSWAAGGTGAREGEDVDNARYWAQQAHAAAGGGVVSFNSRTGSVMPKAGDYTAADVGAAPEGYGLGGNCIIIEDWNKAVKNGWYKNTTYDPENHSPDGYAWYGYVINYIDVLLIQVAYHANAISEVESAMRCCYQGSWGEWQYICPRLTTGREYHLAELYNGKPVYAKLVNLGAGLGDGEIKLVSHGVVNMRDIVSCTGSMSYSDGSNPISLPGISSDGTKTFYLGANYENVIWGAKGTDYTAYYGKALLKYTKLSD